jgi:hypothetical protein
MAEKNGKAVQVDNALEREVTLKREQFIQDQVANMIAGRQQLMEKFLDPRRDVDSECGYPSTQAIQPEFYRELFDRLSEASRVVEVMPQECWAVSPEVFEDEDDENETEFEKAWKVLDNDLRGQSLYQDSDGSPIWEHLERGDKLSGIGHFGVVLLGIDDGLNLEESCVPLGAVGNAPGATHNERAGISDSPLNEADEKLLDQLHQGPATYSYRPFKNGPTINREVPVLNEREKQIVANWKRERVVYNQMVENAKRRRPSGLGDEGQPDDDGRPVRGESGQLTIQPQAQYSQDEQYASGAGSMGMPIAGALSGTDQQYFGVQFGPSQVYTGKPQGKRKLIFLRCFDESLVQIVRYEWNIRNPRFGEPVMYRVTLNDPREQHSGVGLPLATVFVHWSRVIHLARVSDNASSSEIFAPPVMRPVLNNLLNLVKIYGASGEGYWQTAFTILSLETHPQLGGDVKVDMPKIAETMSNIYNSLQRYMVNAGMSAKTLAPTVNDPTPHIDIHHQAICLKTGVPVRIFLGSERGELASSQDKDTWNGRLHGRQVNYITPRIIVPFVDRLIQAGVLPTPKGFSVKWPDLATLTPEQQAAIALQRTQAIAAFVAGGIEQYMPWVTFLEKILDIPAEEANEIHDAALKAQQDMDRIGDENEQFDAPEPPPAIGPGGKPVAPGKPGQPGQSGGQPGKPGGKIPPAPQQPKAPSQPAEEPEEENE